MWREAETKARRLLRVLLLRVGAMPADASRKLLHIAGASGVRDRLFSSSARVRIANNLPVPRGVEPPTFGLGNRLLPCHPVPGSDISCDKIRLFEIGQSSQCRHFAPGYGKLGAELGAEFLGGQAGSIRATIGVIHGQLAPGRRGVPIMSPCLQRALLGTLLLATSAGVTHLQEAPATLFGISIGSKFTPGRDYVFVQENTGTLYYNLRNVSNAEYLLQGVSVSAVSHVVVKVDGRTATGPENVCHRMLFETRAQLKTRYPTLKERIDEVNGTAWHTLSMQRPGCFFNETAAGMSLRLPCSSSFILHCERLSNAFVIEASDTEYSKRARDEAQTIAHAPKRDHLD
jgi:hypothetical protein